jgi:hypothetical protein
MCEDKFCGIFIRQKTCTHHCGRQNCCCVSCQLYTVEEKSPAVICEKYNFLSPGYAYKFIGKFHGRNRYVLETHSIEHCQLENFPHQDAPTVELNRLNPLPDRSHEIQHGGPQEMVNVQQQTAGTQRLPDSEMPIPNGKGYPRMVPSVPKKNRSCPKGMLATKIL